MIECACKPLTPGGVFPPKYDPTACPTHGPDAPRFFVDHGTIHDRVTGRHVPHEDDVDPVASTCALLNTLSDEVDDVRALLARGVELFGGDDKTIAKLRAELLALGTQRG